MPADKVAATKLAVDKAQAKVNELNALQDNYPQARSDLYQAQIELSTAQAIYNAALGISTTTASGVGAVADAPSAESTASAWGPVYYQIVQGRDENDIPTVDLIAVPFPSKTF